MAGSGFRVAAEQGMKLTLAFAFAEVLASLSVFFVFDLDAPAVTTEQGRPSSGGRSF